MTLATPLRKVATKLMSKFGGDVTLRTVTSGVYNPTTGTASETTSDVTIKGVLEDVNATMGKIRQAIAAYEVAAGTQC